jgi:hypothetical protein
MIPEKYIQGQNINIRTMCCIFQHFCMNVRKTGFIHFLVIKVKTSDITEWISIKYGPRGQQLKLGTFTSILVHINLIQPYFIQAHIKAIFFSQTQIANHVKYKSEIKFYFNQFSIAHGEYLRNTRENIFWMCNMSTSATTNYRCIHNILHRVQSLISWSFMV